eukprot:scaffold576_cov260-Pinguiococcus_pyrenoidosus.AAC.116
MMRTTRRQLLRHSIRRASTKTPLLSRETPERQILDASLRSSLVCNTLLRSFEAGKALQPRQAYNFAGSETDPAGKLQNIAAAYRVRPSPLEPLAVATGFLGGAAATLLRPLPGASDLLQKAVSGAVCEHYNDSVRQFHMGELQEEEAELKESFLELRKEAETLGVSAEGDSPMAGGVRPSVQNAVIAAAKVLIQVSKLV